jgi:CheY-like chemotaxis protein
MTFVSEKSFVMKLLVVDDNDRMRRTIKSVVEDLADELFECSDGLDALRMYEQHRPDWVTMDIRMKLTDGLETTRRIRAAYPNAKIVIVTEYDDFDLREDARRAGAGYYVIKRELFDLRKILDSNQ